MCIRDSLVSNGQKRLNEFALELGEVSHAIIWAIEDGVASVVGGVQIADTFVLSRLQVKYTEPASEERRASLPSDALLPRPSTLNMKSLTLCR